MIKLSADQSRAMAVRIEGPVVEGLFKSADAKKGTITITVTRGRGEEPEEKTIAVAKDARVISDGTEVPLGDLLPIENGPLVQVKLSLDQTKAHLVMVRQGRDR